MIIVKNGYYVIKTVLFFAFSQQRTFSIKELSQRLGISIKVMEQVLSIIKKAGLLSSKRGPQGGYTIDKNLYDMSLMEVLNKTGQRIEVLPTDKKVVPIDDVMYDIGNRIGKDIENYLTKTKIWDLTAQMIGKVAEKELTYTI